MEASVATKPQLQTTRWKPYPVYKPSGAEWLGEIPAHWEIRKLKHIASVVFSNVDKHTIEGEQPVKLCNYVDVYYNDYITEGLEFMEATATPEEVAKFALRESDVIVTKDSESWDDIAVAAYVSSNLNNVLCGYHLALIRPNGEVIDGRFLFRSFRARGINDQFRVAANGITRYGLPKHRLDSSIFLIPPLDEQLAIAAFLDRETARIDALIARKQRLIELLQEKRTALISHAVTKGLDPNGSMKDSGMGWLGEIPTNWEVRRLKSLVSLVTSGSRGWAEHYADSGPLFLRIGNLSRQSIELDLSDIQHVDPPTGAEGVRTRVQSGDVLISVTADIGSIGVVPDGIDEAYVNQHIALTRPQDEHVLARWMAYSLASQIGQSQFRQLQYGGTKVGLGLDDVKGLRILLPPYDEQMIIVSELDEAVRQIESLVTRINDGIAKLREYRTALISAAVTGKIDVRKEVMQQGVRA